MVTKIKAALKPTIVIEDVVFTHTTKPTFNEAILANIKGMAVKYNVTLPSTVRVVCSWIACILAGFGIGFIAAPIIDMIAMAALTMSSSLTFGLIVYVLSMCVMIYASYFLGKALDTFITSGAIDRSYQKCSNAVRGFFSSTNKEVTA